jgi:hypothetical protein
VTLQVGGISALSCDGISENEDIPCAGVGSSFGAAYRAHNEISIHEYCYFRDEAVFRFPNKNG